MNHIIINILKISIIFLIGFLSANLVNSHALENPVLKTFGFSAFNSTPAPSDFIKESQINVYPDKIVIKINDASIGNYAPTGSMIPVLDEGSNGIRIVPKSENEIHEGDIISFKKNNELIIHRVVKKAKDENGTYFITKGDNNDLTDGKIRFKDIKYLTVGILW
jgi:hypothetical protein